MQSKVAWHRGADETSRLDWWPLLRARDEDKPRKMTTAEELSIRARILAAGLAERLGTWGGSLPCRFHQFTTPLNRIRVRMRPPSMMMLSVLASETARCQ